MPEIIELNKLKDNLYREGSPIVIQSGELSLNAETNDITASLTFKSISNKIITAVLVDIHIFNIANNEVEVAREYLYNVDNATRNTIFGDDMTIDIASASSKTISVALRKVTFDDDTVWNGSASLLFEAIPPRKTLEAELEDDETIEQFKRDFANIIAKDNSAVAKFVPAEYKDLWLCSCGVINLADENECYSCKAEYAPQKTHINNRVEIEANLLLYKQSLVEAAEKARLEALRKAEEAEAAKIEAAKLAEEERIRLENIAKRKKRTKNTIIAITIPTVIAIIAYFILLFTYLIPQGKYTDAKQLITDNRFDEAITAFSSMNGYSDSTKQVTEAKLQKAEKYLADKKYDDAIAGYKLIEKERDVTKKIENAKFLKADALFAASKFDEALKLFTEVKDYTGAGGKINECHFALTNAAIEAGNIAVAIEHFNTLTGARSLEIQEIFSKEGSKLYKAGKTDEAVAYFALVTDLDLLKNIDGVYYDTAMKLIKDKKYDESEKILTKISSYKDSKDQLLRINFLKAEALKKASNYTDAIALYKKAGDYENAKNQIKECNYLIANQYFLDGQYSDAEKTFKALKDYKDSKSMVTESIYQLGSALLSNGDIVDAYNTLYAIKNNDKAFALLVSNSQFYIYVYDAGIGPNPLDEK